MEGRDVGVIQASWLTRVLGPRHRRITPLRQPLSIALAILAPGFLLFCVSLRRFSSDWQQLFPTAATMEEAARQIPFAAVVVTLMGATVGLLFTTPALLVWAALHRLRLASPPVFLLAGLVVGEGIGLALNGQALAPMTLDFMITGGLTALLVWCVAYGGKVPADA